MLSRKIWHSKTRDPEKNSFGFIKKILGLLEKYAKTCPRPRENDDVTSHYFSFSNFSYAYDEKINK
jgi:hypothetical protein